MKILGNKAVKAALWLGLGIGLALGPWAAWAQRPQIVIAVGNSESMDGAMSGTLGGAIMTGSGALQTNANIASLVNSSSPVNYAVPAGFTPPLQAANAQGNAPYTVSNGGVLYDNSSSRLNVAKAGIASVLSQYLSSMDFALETYSTSAPTLYNTWYYAMSLPAGFTFTNTQVAGTTYITNPCYGVLSGSANTQNTVSYSCAQMATYLFGNGFLNQQYMAISASSDDAAINDVFYTTGTYAPVYVEYGTITAYIAVPAGCGSGQNIYPNAVPPTTPYTRYTLANYENNQICLGYSSTAPTNQPNVAFPTNAGYLPFTTQVIDIQRGFGYGASQSATTGTTVVAMTHLGANPTAAAVTTSLNSFTPYLAPETNTVNTLEIKASAGQASTAGLVAGAGSVLSALTASCAGQYVILLTDGLPTYDSSGNNWPPLGSLAGVGYGVYATFAGIAASPNYGILNGTGSTAPVGTLLTGAGQTKDQALIDTISQIQKLNSKGIKTFVIGLGAGVDPSQNPAAYDALNAMAIAGGTGQEYPATDIASFNAAINSIVAQIFTSIQVTAPVAPSSASSGSLIYVPTSNTVSGSIAGHLQAYQTANGIPSGTALWDAGDATHMPVATRQNHIYSTAATAAGQPAGSGNAVLLSSMGTAGSAQYDATAFTLASPPTTCVPNIATQLAYTFDPSFGTAGDSATLAGLGFPTAIAGCSYLAGRQLNWMLGGFSANDYMQFLGPPGSADLLSMSGYVTFAQNNAGREQLVLMSSNDGILYAVDATTGMMVWGWMPRPFVAQLQNYTAFETSSYFDGKYDVVDAVDTTASPAASDWATYVVGTAQGGAYHYALKLSSNGSGSSAAPTPIAQTWGISVAGGSSPQMQAPLVINALNSQYAVFVVNTTNTVTSVTTSTFYEINVATGQASSGTTLSAVLPFVANSAMSFDSVTGTLWIGDKSGGIWNLNITGTAPTDVASAIEQGVTNPAAPVNYVGYTEVNGMAYAWAATQSEITVFGLSGGVSQPLWASSTSSGYQESNTGNTLTAVSSSVVMPLQTNGQISAAPAFVNGVLVVPVYVPPGSNTCGTGTGDYDLFNLTTGGLPQTSITYQGSAVLNGIVSIGPGIPLTPTISMSGDGELVYPGTNSSNSSNNSLPSTSTPIVVGGGVIDKPIGWRQL